MANEFHRLVAPVAGDYVRAGWSGGIPHANFVDWMNNDPAAPGPMNIPAPANGALSMAGNPYNGTFFVGGKEDAADVFANRAHAALASNIDQIDNAIRRGVAVIQRHVWAGGAITFTFPIGTVVWVGSGMPGNEVEIVNRFDMANLVTSVGGLLYASAWTIGAPDAAGFATITDVTFNEAVLPGQYYIYIGTKAGLAELPRDAMFTHLLHGIPQISPKVQVLLQQLHAPVGSLWQQNWDAAWGTTIEELALSGLNERYHRSRTANGLHLADDYAKVLAAEAGWVSPALANTAGGGAWILRAGAAPTVVSSREVANPLATDRLNACWRAVMVDHPATGGGSSGFVVHGGRTSTESTRERGPGLFSFAHMKANRQSTADWYGAGGWTVIPDGGAAEVGYEVIDGVTELVLHLDALGTARFWKFYNAPPAIPPGNYSYVVTGFDTIEVVDPADGLAKHWLIYRMDPADDQKCILRSTSGKPAPVGKPSGGYANGVPTAVTCTWNSALCGASDGAAEQQLQLTRQVNEYLPGSYPLPCPSNYGFNVLGGPVPNLVSHYGAGELQMFDQAIMSLYATTPTGAPVLQWGTKQLILDGFGQTPPTAYGSLLSNGNIAGPVLFTSAIRPYNMVDPTALVRAECSMMFMDGTVLNVPALVANTLTSRTGTLELFPTQGDASHFLFLGPDADLILVHNNPANPFHSLSFLGESRGLHVVGMLGYYSREALERGKLEVDIAATPSTQDLFLDLYSWVNVRSCAAGSPAELHLNVRALVAQSDHQGRIYTVYVSMDPAYFSGLTGLLNVIFESSDPAVHVNTSVHAFNYVAGHVVGAYYDIYLGQKTGAVRNMHVSEKAHGGELAP